MREGAAAVAIVAVILLSGCAGIGAGFDDDPATDGPRLVPALPDTVALADGTLVSRDAHRAVFAWEGVVEGGATVVPVVGMRAVERTAHTELRLPADVPLRLDATLAWNGSANLDLFVFDELMDRCESFDAHGGALDDVSGSEACRTWLAPGAPRAWGVDVVNRGSGAEPIPFQVVVTVQTYAAAPMYDVASGPAPRESAPDPTTAGPYDVAMAEYDFGTLVVEDRVTKRAYPVRVVGVAHFASGERDALPLVVLLHGRHQACEGPVQQAHVFSHCRAPAPAGSSVPSHRGYDDAAHLLASHGYAVVSIDANDINAMDSPRGAVASGDDGMDARAKLLLRTLDEFRGIHERGGSPANPGLDALRGRLDLARIGLMGHSRGAEGVTRAPGYADEVDHWAANAILAVYALAGTTRPSLPDYLTPIVRAPTAYLALSPYCDGDVRFLGNYDFFDTYKDDPERGWLAHLLVMGANHNYYNSEWPNDDAERWGNDIYCAVDGYGRLSPEDQQRQQLAYLPAFFRLHLGDETTFAPLFTGEAPPPAAACPRGLSACPGLVHVSVQPSPLHMLSIEDATTDEALVTNDLGRASAFEGFDDVTWCDPRAAEEGDACAWPRAVGNAPRLRLAWTGDAEWRTVVSTAASDLRSYDALAFRVGVDWQEGSAPGGVPPRVDVVIEDARGRRAQVDASEHGAAIFSPPGDNARRVTLNQVRIPLDAFGEVDLARVAAVELRFSGATPGAVHVADLAAINLD